LRVKGKKIIDVIEINGGFVMIFQKIPPKPIWIYSWRRITSAVRAIKLLRSMISIYHK